MRHPVLKVNPAVAVLVVAITCSTNEMTANICKCTEMASCRKITDGEGNSNAGDSPIAVVCYTRISNLSLLGNYEVIDKWVNIVVEIFHRPGMMPAGNMFSGR